LKNIIVASLQIKIFKLFLKLLGISCEPLPLLYNSTLIGPTDITGTRYEDTATYSCIEGYEITNRTLNSTTINCQSDKTWSTLQSCTSKYI